MKRLSIALWLVMGTAGAARAECPDRFEFVIIADDTGELALSDPQFGPRRAIPSLGPDGRVAFTSWLDAGGRAVLVGDENNLVIRARDRDADPDSDWTYLENALLGGDVAFFKGMVERADPFPQSWPALGAANNASIVDEIAVGEPGARFRSFGDVDVTSDGQLAIGVDDEELGPAIAAARFGEGLRVIESGESSAYGSVSIGQGDDVAYMIVTGGGLRLISASGAVVAETDPDTGLGPNSPISMGPGTGIAYFFSYADPQRPGYAATQIRRWNPSTLTSSTLADSGAGDFGLHAEGHKVSLLDQTGLGGSGPSPGWGGCVAFLAGGDDGRDAIFIADEDGIDLVVQEEDEVAGHIARFLDMGPMAVYATGQIAFWAKLDGREAIIRADPITEGGGGDDGGDDDDGEGDDDGDGDGDGMDGGDDAGGDAGEESSGGCLSVAGGGSTPWGVLIAIGLIALRARRRR